MECLPSTAAYDGELEIIKTDVIRIVTRMLGIIEQNPCDSCALQKLAAKGPDLLQIPKAEPVRVALLGDTGAGKLYRYQVLGSND